MSNKETLSFGLSDADVRAINSSSLGKVSVSKEAVAKTRSSGFVPWNCPFDECMPAAIALRSE